MAAAAKGKITKAQLIEFLSVQAGIPKTLASQNLDALQEFIVKNLKAGNDVAFGTLGIFRKRISKARMGRNPATGAPLKIPARKKVKFSPSKSMKEAVL